MRIDVERFSHRSIVVPDRRIASTTRCGPDEPTIAAGGAAAGASGR
jgi:hypothetical protein